MAAVKWLRERRFSNYKGRLYPIVNTLDFVDIVAASSWNIGNIWLTDWKRGLRKRDPREIYQIKMMALALWWRLHPTYVRSNIADSPLVVFTLKAAWDRENCVRFRPKMCREHTVCWLQRKEPTAPTTSFSDRCHRPLRRGCANVLSRRYSHKFKSPQYEFI